MMPDRIPASSLGWSESRELDCAPAEVAWKRMRKIYRINAANDGAYSITHPAGTQYAFKTNAELEARLRSMGALEADISAAFKDFCILKRAEGNRK
jgi:hypothetical protein